MTASEIWEGISDTFNDNPEYFGYVALGILCWELLLFSTLGLYIFICRRKRLRVMRDLERNYGLSITRVNETLKPDVSAMTED